MHRRDRGLIDAVEDLDARRRSGQIGSRDRIRARRTICDERRLDSVRPTRECVRYFQNEVRLSCTVREERDAFGSEKAIHDGSRGAIRHCHEQLAVHNGAALILERNVKTDARTRHALREIRAERHRDGNAWSARERVRRKRECERNDEERDETHSQSIPRVVPRQRDNVDANY